MESVNTSSFKIMPNFNIGMITITVYNTHYMKA